MAYSHGRLGSTKTQVPPVVAELEALFKEIPDEDLLKKLKGPRRCGRPGYRPRTLWRCYMAFFYLGLPSISDLLRALHDNPYLAQVCGIPDPSVIPSQPTFSRFFSRLASRNFRTLVRNVQRGLTRRLHEVLPDFGKSVAIDSTDVKAWSNGGKRHGASDPDAGWIVKTNTEGNKKYVWGYKVHVLCDTKHEIPLVVDISRGNLHDVKKATPLLAQARYAYSRFAPDYVLADAGYSDDRLRKAIWHIYRGKAIIDPNPAHKRAFARTERTAEWKVLYNRRTAIERWFGRAKAHRRLNSVRVRGRFKVMIHTLLATIICQANYLATGSRISVRKIAVAN